MWLEEDCMKNRALLFAGLLALSVCLAALSGCMPPTGPLSSSDSDGSVVVSFSDGRARTIRPAVSLDIATCDISFRRAGQGTVTFTGVSGSMSQTEPVYLKPGIWSVTATRYVSWVQNVARQFGPYLVWAQET
jgi:hypothetical protein